MGTCTNKRGIPRPILEAFIIDNLKHHLMAPELVKQFIAEFTAETNRSYNDRDLQATHKRKELADVSRRLDGLIMAIADGLRTTGLEAKLEELEQRKSTLEAELAAAAPKPPLLHPHFGGTLSTQGCRPRTRA